MTTNKYFSFTRFVRLIKSDLLINYKKYLLLVLAAFVLCYGFLYLNMPKRNFGDSYYFDINRYMDLFMVTLFALGAFVGLSFPAFSNKKATRTYLLTPASTLEKYTVQIFGRFILTSLIFLLIFWLSALLARYTAIHAVKPDEAPPAITVFHYSDLWAAIRKDEFSAWFFPFMILSIGMFLFSVRLFFRKAGLLKTVLSLAVVIFSFFGLMVLFSHIFYPAQVKGWDIHGTTYQLLPKLNNGEFFSIIIFSISWLFLLVFGYFKLKEKEV